MMKVELYSPPVNNMIKIIQSYLIDKKRPKNIYHYKFTEIIKYDNPNIVSVKYHHA